MVALINELRKHGYDRLTRAGSSMYTFVLSRSAKHGLGNRRAFMTFNLASEGKIDIILYEYLGTPCNPYTALTLEQPALTPQLYELLARLLKQSID